MNLAVAAKNARLQALADLIDTGGAGTLTLYTGTKPAQADDAITTQTALVDIPCPLPIADSISNGTLHLAAFGSEMAVETGQATWARLKNGNGDVVADLVVGTDIALASTQIYPGVLVQINTAAISE
ncbi:hypothetical protein QKW35_20600 [Pontibacterium granulatum]|uniref:hypothetical protein n=1 Tax=Pontibacterium granulatum TaxID=2036029 RepID=UPI00249A0974|nr:hypothetical protein [Pontibacterium granulatum]MDI3326784.1 hypothetical protein [Pontibacterium granulatum]